LGRAFDATNSAEWQSLGSFQASYNSNGKDGGPSKSDEVELFEAKKGVREDLFSFMSDVVTLVIAFDFSVNTAVNTAVGTSTNDKDLTFA